MKKALEIGTLGWLLTAVAGWTATAPIYVNDSPLDCFDRPPQIDATAFVNRSFFCATTFTFPLLPYETLNTRFFTNTASGRITGEPGYRFNYASGNTRNMMDSWVNRGTLTVDNTLVILISGNVVLPFAISGTTANWLMVSSSNLVNSGLMSVGSQGLLRLEGKDVDMSRARLRSGQTPTTNGFFNFTSVLSSNYFNDVGITDLYWGTGTNNALDDMGAPLNLVPGGFGSFSSFDLPFPRSPIHEVVDSSLLSSFLFTNNVVVPAFLQGGYDARVLRTQTGATNFAVQVVFFPTNSFDTNVSTTVEFLPGSGLRGGAWVSVGFHARDFDIVNQVDLTNSVYLVDASAFRTNTFLARNFNAGTRRPGHFEVLRNDPFEFFTTIESNAIFSPSLLYRPTMASNEVEVIYSGYQAQISSVNTPGLTIPGNPLADPTNYPGRIEIVGDRVNLSQTKVRADSTFVLRAENLVSNEFAAVDAPYMAVNVGSTQPNLLITNIAPPSVSRLSGTISAWAGTWRNFETNAIGTNQVLNAIDFHVLIVDPVMQGQQPVFMNEFKASAPSITLADPLNVISQFELDTPSLEVQNNLTLPFRVNWASTNVLNLMNFTNRGTINLSSSGFFGTDRDQPYDVFVNEGGIRGTSLFVDSLQFDNRGHLVAESGFVSIEAQDATMAGSPTVIVTNFFTNLFLGFTSIVAVLETNSFGPLIGADSDVIFTAETLTMSNAILHAGVSSVGTLVLEVADLLSAPYGSGTNEWSVSGGLHLPVKPAQSDLLGLRVDSLVDPFTAADHIWPGEDLGRVNEGYTNNLAVGRLVLDQRGRGSVHRFTAPDGNNAMYVEFLQLENYATNYFPTTEFPENRLDVRPGMMLYFADSNVSADKLNGASQGRIRWISSFAGPHSSTNFTYPDGTVYTFNRSLVLSRDLDSDSDGIPNFFDPTPIFVEGNINLSAAPMDNQGAGGSNVGLDQDLILSWNALGQAENVLLYSDSLAPGATWQVLTQFVGGVVTARVHVVDTIPSGKGQRFYRVKIGTPNP